MDKQRNIYRQLIIKLFEENFTSALFHEKTDTMMKIADLETIRNEIEEEYFEKNRGITPYIRAIKYLCTKIESCTADNTLFAPIEDYICAKENIMVTKIAKEKVPVVTVTVKSKKRAKDRKQLISGNGAASVGHAECNSPHPCKKCGFMRRLDRPKSDMLTKRNKKTSKPSKLVTEQKEAKVKSDVKTVVKTEMPGPAYPNYMETIENVINASKEVIKPKPKSNSQARDSNQLPYQDHEYSRITFYGSGDASDTKPQATTIQDETKSARKQLQAAQKPRQKTQNIRPKPIIYRFKPNNGLQQPGPVYFDSSIASTSIAGHYPPPPVIRTIHRPLPSGYASSNVPLHFKTPIAFVHGSVIHQPIYYLHFSNPQE